MIGEYFQKGGAGGLPRGRGGPPFRVLRAFSAL